MDKMKLKATMVLHNDTIRSLAEYLGITPQSVSSKINESGTEFKQGEISMIASRYKLTPEEITDIFFN